MALFKYTAMDKSGRTVGSLMEADSEATLSKALRRDGLFLMEAVVVTSAARAAARTPAAGAPKPAAAPARAPAAAPRKGRVSVPLKDVSIFTSQFSLMAKAAIPALQAIGTLGGQQPNLQFRDILADIQERLKRGEYLSHAFSQHPEVFDQVYITLLAAGEASGTVSSMLATIAAYIEFQSELKRKVRAAMVYPSLVLLASFTVVFFLLFFVLPHFVEIFDQFDAELPLPTQILLGLSTLLRAYWLALLLGAGALYYLGRRWLSQPSNKALVDEWTLGIPILGPMIEAIILTRILRIFAVLMRGGVPILRILDLCKNTANHSYYEKLIDGIIASVSEGRGIAAALFNKPHFPGSLADMVSTAERTGNLPEVFSLAADHYEKELDARIESAFSALEPIFIGFLSMVVAGIAICILSPIMNLGTLVE